MDDFVNCLSICDMVDIQATGAFYTWTNKQDAGDRKFSRLDRFLVNPAWISMYPEMVGHFHPEGLLDHNPCVISNKNLNAATKRSFKYFNMWGSAAEFFPMIKEVWDDPINGTKMFCIVKKLKSLKPKFKNLNAACYSDIEIQVLK
ncbi:uncharacterized protein LOC141633026 [Silene latifolia]|uniref:uncharacterized protein LOC141633026 n=1 Tax=Silene latifolia TaxID=37657 RepID=UPI003D77FDAD